MASVTAEGKSVHQVGLDNHWSSPVTRYLSFLVRPDPVPTKTPLPRYRTHFGIELASGPWPPETFFKKKDRGDRDRSCQWRNGQALTDEVNNRRKPAQTTFLIYKKLLR